MSDFLGDTFKSLSQGVVGVLDALFDKTPKEFDTFQDVLEMFEGGIKLPNSSLLGKLKEHIPNEFLKAVIRTNGAPILKYPMPDIIKGEH